MLLLSSRPPEYSPSESITNTDRAENKMHFRFNDREKCMVTIIIFMIPVKLRYENCYQVMLK